MQVQNISAFILAEAGEEVAPTVVLFESQSDLEDYMTDDDYDDEGYKLGKVGMGIVLVSKMNSIRLYICIYMYLYEC